MYKIKQKPEDFIVKEISNIKLDSKGKYTYFLLKKKDYTTLRALEMTARELRTPVKKFGFAGNKDRRAVTSQLCSAEGVSEKRLEEVKLKDIEISFKGKGDKPVCLGDLEGNSFEIVVRNISSKPELKQKFVNYFGAQRFSRNNPAIGKVIVKRDFKHAIELILEGKGNFEGRTKEFLEKNSNDYVGALKTIPRKILSLYVHSYQSLLWNQQAKNSTEETVPIIGFNTLIDSKIIEKEGIKLRDFIIKEIPQLSSEGGERKRLVEAANVSISELEKDELNCGKKKILIKFTLPKGSYATEYIRQLFSIA